MKRYVGERGSVNGFDGKYLTNEDLFKLDVDILIPAAIGGVITQANAGEIEAKLVVEGANAPTTKEGEEILLKKGTVVVPDILANAGGVVASYDEWMMAKSGSKTDRKETYATIEKTLTQTFEEVINCSLEENISLRKAALVLATARLVQTMSARGWI